jgi:hypothetical protein
MLVGMHFRAVHLAAPGLVAVTAPMALFRRDGGGLEKPGLHGPAFRGLGTLLSVLCSRAVVVQRPEPFHMSVEPTRPASPCPSWYRCAVFCLSRSISSFLLSSWTLFDARSIYPINSSVNLPSVECSVWKAVAMYVTRHISFIF